jgi:hypothetical protein
LTWNRDTPEKAIGVWTLTGDSLPTQGVTFELWDTKQNKWIGEGQILNKGKTATLSSGHWSDLCAFERNTTGLVLVIFNHS